MFDFVEDFDHEMSKRLNDIEANIKTKSHSVFVTMQSYLEYLCKIVDANEGKKFDVGNRNVLGHYLRSYKFTYFIADTIGFSNKEALSKINHYANKYKHERMEYYPEETIKEAFHNIFNLTKKVISYLTGKTIDARFKDSYFQDLIDDFENSEKLKEKTIENKLSKDYIDKEKYQSLVSDVAFLKQKIEKLKEQKDAQNSLIEQYNNDKKKFLDNEKTIKTLKKQINDLKDSQQKNATSLINEQNSKIETLIEENDRLKTSLENIENQNDDPLLTMQQKIKKQNSILEAKQETIENLKSQMKDKQENDLNNDSMFESFRSERIAMIFSNSYDEDDVSYSITHVTNDAVCQSQYESYYAVVNNMLQRSMKINASSYLLDAGVDTVELKTIIRFQMALLALIKNNVLTDSKWDIHIINGDKKLFDYALEDLFKKVELISSLSKDNYERPKISITKDKEFKPSKVNITYDQQLYLDHTIYQIDDLSFKSDSFNMWVSETIDYRILERHKQVLEPLMYELFGHNSFREGQFPILRNILNGHHTIGILPTGGGKSLVYQFSGLLQPKMSLIVAPINALIKDQIHKLKDVYNIDKVLNITGSNSEHKKEHEKRFRDGQALFAFVSPERLQIKYFRNHLIHLGNTGKIGNVVLDEVHCLSEWGHDFRISYLMLSHTLNTYLRDIQYLGLTATASVNVVKDLKVELQIYDDSNIIFADNLRRDNLTFKVKEFSSDIERRRYLKELLSEHYGQETSYDISLRDEKTNAIVIFAKTRYEVEDIKKTFKTNFDDEIDHFHGGYKESQEAFMNNKRSLLVATKAFGMGVDKPNIRATIHYGPPSSRENFYQEAGRAGRDLKPSDCHIFTYESKEYKSLIDEFLRLDTKIPRLKSLKAKMRFKTDLSANFHFLAENIKEPKQEAKEVIEHYKQYIYYSKQSTYHIPIISKEQNKMESILYILHKVGIVENWSKTYHDLHFLTLEVTIDKRAKDFNHIKRKAKTYISVYGPDSKYLDYIDKHFTSIRYLAKLIYSIRKWYHDNFIRARREQLANMYAFINKYKNKDASESIQNELEQFFDISSLIDKSDEGYSLRFEDDDIVSILEKAATLDESMIQKRILQMERMLESYTNENIDLYTALIHLRGDQYNSRNGNERLINRLNQMQSKDVKLFYKNILPELYEVLSDSQKISLLGTLYNLNYDLFNHVMLSSVKNDSFLKAYTMDFINKKLQKQLEELSI